MTTIVFDVVAFRASYPAFASVTQYPDAVLSGYFLLATCYIDADESPCSILAGGCLVAALNLLTAHLAYLNTQIADGVNPGLLSGATIDKVSVSLTSPPAADQWRWWLNLSPYGAQLLALLSVKAAGGFYIGGRPERSAFRKVGGRF